MLAAACSRQAPVCQLHHIQCQEGAGRGGRRLEQRLPGLGVGSVQVDWICVA